MAYLDSNIGGKFCTLDMSVFTELGKYRVGTDQFVQYNLSGSSDSDIWFDPYCAKETEFVMDSCDETETREMTYPGWCQNHSVFQEIILCQNLCFTYNTAAILFKARIPPSKLQNLTVSLLPDFFCHTT